jgi:hypothetical protein
MATLSPPIGINDQWDVTLRISPERVLDGNDVQLEVILFNPGFTGNIPYGSFLYAFDSSDPRIKANLANIRPTSQPNVFLLTIPNLPEGSYEVSVTVTPSGSPPITPTFPIRTVSASFFVVPRQVQAAVTLQRTGTFPTDDQALWVAIRNRTSALDFVRYQRFINRLFCVDDSLDISQVLSASQKVLPIPQQLQAASGIPQDEQRLSIYGPYAYALLTLATQVFLTLECGVVIRNPEGGNSLFRIEDEFIRLNDFTVSLTDLQTRLARYLAPFDSQALPYLDRIVPALITLDPEKTDEVLPYCFGILQHRLTCPALLELIWSYWHEEGMLVQTMNAIAYRFQNRRSGPRDPLGELELDPLRPLNNLIWGLIQDEHNRLTVPRRAYEYVHHYGLQLVGKAVPNMASADSRSKFIEAFHNLLYRTAVFYREDSDTTVIADAFPLLNTLKEVHLLLAEGAHNQFGDLPWTGRAEMLSMQWLLARPEMREFLRGRYMVPYQEQWMGAVDSMKKLQGWTDTTVTHFHDLAVTGERILLSVRYGDWVDLNNTQEQAKNWARYWKPEVQRYIHAYQAVTGVDLMSDITDTREAARRFLQPSMLLQHRLSAQRAPRSLLAARVSGTSTLEAPAYAELPMPRGGRLLRHGED